MSPWLIAEDALFQKLFDQCEEIFHFWVPSVVTGYNGAIEFIKMMDNFS